MDTYPSDEHPSSTQTATRANMVEARRPCDLRRRVDDLLRHPSDCAHLVWTLYAGGPHLSQSLALPIYTAYSLLRIAIAYAMSLVFALGFGYAASRSERAERLLIPLLDILQSIPVLSFLPGVMLAMVALFPHSQIGLELGAITLIFTGQVWNLAF